MTNRMWCSVLTIALGAAFLPSCAAEEDDPSSRADDAGHPDGSDATDRTDRGDPGRDDGGTETDVASPDDASDEVAPIACSVEGAPCDDGEPCTTDDTCSGGVCAGDAMTCGAPPPGECLSGTRARVYSPEGTCDGAGGCDYTATEVDCPEGCRDGYCAAFSCTESCNISRSPAQSGMPKVAIDSSGAIMVVWEEGPDREHSVIRYAVRSAGGWSAPAEIPGQGAGGSVSPDVFRRSGGGFVAVWHELGCDCIRFAEYGGSWSIPEQINEAGGYDLGNPKVVTTPSGRVAVCYQRSLPWVINIEIFVRIRDGAWGPEANVSNTELTAKYCDLYPSPDGRILVAFQNNRVVTETEEAFDPMFNMDDGHGGWGASRSVETTLGTWLMRPVVTASGSGDMIVAYYNFPGREFLCSVGDGVTWRPFERIGSPWIWEHDAYYADAAQLGGGAIFVYKNDVTNVAYAVRCSDGWRPPIEVTASGNTFHPAVDYQSAVGAVVVWQDTSTGEVMLRVLDPGDACGPAVPVGIHPVYRFVWVSVSGDADHMFSTDTAVPPGYASEGTAFQLFDEPGAGRIPLWQSWCASCTDHMQGHDPAEGVPSYVDPVLLGYCGAAESTAAPVELRRIWCPGSTDHFMSADLVEWVTLAAAGCTREGSCWVPRSP